MYTLISFGILTTYVCSYRLKWITSNLDAKEKIAPIKMTGSQPQK